MKANAYGHGLALCAPAAVQAGAHWLGVTSVEEGVAARESCPDAEILVIGGPFSGQGAAMIAHRLTAVVWEPWQIEELEATEEMLIASQDYIKKCGAEEKKITQRLEGSK